MRRKVADANDIPLQERECTHTGDCAGTCPYCESEVRYLERELSKRRALGKAVAVAGIAMLSVAPAAAQTPETSEAGNEPQRNTDPTIPAVPDSAKPCDTYRMMGIVPKSDSSAADISVEELSEEEPPVLGLAIVIDNSDVSLWRFPSSQGTLKSYMRQGLKHDLELRKWLRRKIKSQLRDKSKEDMFEITLSPQGEVFGVDFEFAPNAWQYGDLPYSRRLYQLFWTMPKWELLPKAEQPKHYVRQKMSLRLLW